MQQTVQQTGRGAAAVAAGRAGSGFISGLLLPRSSLRSQCDGFLIACCQKGDRAAFDEIVARYKNRIFVHLYHMTRSREEAEDLTQEVFVRMYTNIAFIRKETPLGVWLYRVAGNIAVDAFRRSKKERSAAAPSLDAPPTAAAMAHEEGARDIPDWSGEPLKLLGHSELAAQIQAALQALPPKLRAAVLLHDVEGLRYEEIARIEQVPLGTVKSRLFNARMALRQRLQPYLEV